jgi:type VI secretion system protein ImpM
MPEPLTGDLRPAVLCRGAVGFHGKIPARGDFVRFGLPRGFVAAWDGWLQRVIAASRAELGEEWLPAWLEAAIWRFALSPGLCGPDAVLGLWMPSVDSVGRYFPLTFAVAVPDADAAELVHEGGGFLAAAEEAGLAAVTDGLGPDDLAARLLEATFAAPADPGADPMLCAMARALWWTGGAPRSPAGAFVGNALPSETTFAGMLDARRCPSPIAAEGWS